MIRTQGILRDYRSIYRFTSAGKETDIVASLVKAFPPGHACLPLKYIAGPLMKHRLLKEFNELTLLLNT